jgi:hypothetical protein
MERIPPTLDMRLDGSFNSVPRHTPSLSFKLMLGAIMLAVVGAAIAFAALALWVFAMILPVVIVAAAFAWGLMKFRLWQASRSGSTLRPF